MPKNITKPDTQLQLTDEQMKKVKDLVHQLEFVPGHIFGGLSSDGTLSLSFLPKAISQQFVDLANRLTEEGVLPKLED